MSLGKFFATVWLLVGVACQAQARDEPRPDEIIVIGAPLPAGLGELAYDTVTISRERLTSTASGRLEDALRDVAGLSQFRRTDARSANATSQGATLRGLGGNATSRALVMLDGVPQSDPFGGWITWPAFSPERLGEVRVTRGGGSGVAGPGALAGTIALDSAGDVRGLTATAVYGSRDAIDASAILGGKLGAGSGFVSASYARGHGFIPIIKAQRGLVDQAAPYEQASVAARGVAPLNGQLELQASLLAFTDRRTRGTAFSNNGGDGADASVRLVNRGRWGWQALAYVQVRKFKSRFVSIDAARAVVTPTVNQYNVPSTGLGARFEVRPPVGDAIELRIGGDWRRVSGETNEQFTFVAGQPTRGREAGGRSEHAGAFVEMSAHLQSLTLTAGARLDHWSIKNGRLIETTLATGTVLRSQLSPDRSGWEPTARAGLAYHAGPITLRGAAYLGWRLPTLNELYRPFRLGADATAANPALAPERMRGAEIGIDLAPTKSIAVRATLFANRLVHPIANVTLASGPGVFPGVGFIAAGGVYRQRQNLDAIKAKGLELDLSWREGPWSLAASYAYTDSKISASGVAAPLSGLRPAQVPKHMASLTAGWRGLSLTGRTLSSQFEDDQNQRSLRGVFIVDASATFALTANIALIFRGENIGNRRIEAAVSSAGIVEQATPRTLWVGFRFKP
jgi:vitamin B12 transporter